MNKVILILSLVLAGSVVTALMFARDVQQERARADALAERLLELEPVEKVGLVPPSAKAQAESTAVIVAETPIAPLSADADVSATGPKAVMEFSGSLRARKQVERLQTALVSGTPLQDYQIRALISAIDDVHREMSDRAAVAYESEADAKADERMIEVAADILFESQLEVFIELLRRQGQVPQREAG